MSLTVEVTGLVETTGSVWVAEGVVVADPDVETAARLAGHHVRFGGDWRPMRDIERALERGEEVRATVEDWQLL